MTVEDMMKFRKLAASDLNVFEISPGSWLTYGARVDHGAATSCVDRTFRIISGLTPICVRDGLLARHPDPDNGRLLMSELTLARRKILTDAHKAVHRVENRMIAVFVPRAADKVAEQLSRCAYALIQQGALS